MSSFYCFIYSSFRTPNYRDLVLCIADVRQPQPEVRRVLHSDVTHTQPSFHADGERLLVSGIPHQPPTAQQILLVDPNSQTTEQVIALLLFQFLTSSLSAHVRGRELHAAHVS